MEAAGDGAIAMHELPSASDAKRVRMKYKPLRRVIATDELYEHISRCGSL